VPDASGVRKHALPNTGEGVLSVIGAARVVLMVVLFASDLRRARSRSSLY
jgi:hypothetical protein